MYSYYLNVSCNGVSVLRTEKDNDLERISNVMNVLVASLPRGFVVTLNRMYTVLEPVKASCTGV